MITVAYGWFKKFKIHVLVWSMFILYETVVIGLIFNVFGHPVTYLIHYSVAILLLYIHADLSLPWSSKSKIQAIWKVPLIIAAELWVYILLSFIFDAVLINFGFINHIGRFELNETYYLKTLYRGLLFAGFGTGYYYLKKFNVERERVTQLEKQRLTEIINKQRFEQQLAKAENDFLKAQINPHFLFNTLDFIYHNILSVAPTAANTIIALSDMMRFAIDADKTGGFIELGDEIEQVKHLIYLTQVRKKKPLNFVLDADKSVFDIKLIPLILLTLTENMIKHGDLENFSKPGKFQIRLNDSQLIVETTNLIKFEHVGEKTGNGIRNIKQRLSYAYGEKVQFEYDTVDESIFKTKITIWADAFPELATSSGKWSNIDTKGPHEPADFH